MKKTKADIQKIPVYSPAGKKVELIELDKDIFNGRVNKSLLYQAVTMYRANEHRGTASTKTRDEVAGSGKKPWRQKGTGRARVGSIRNPVWRGGGIVFGPRPRDYRYSLPAVARRGAFISGLNARLAGGKVLAIEEENVNEPKARIVAGFLRTLKIREKTLILVSSINRNFYLACRNIKNVELKKITDATALDVLKSGRVIISRSAAAGLKKVFKK